MSKPTRSLKARASLIAGIAIALVAAVEDCALADDPAPAANIDFSRQVLPILAKNCLACHGPDENQRQADLRLDLRESAVDAVGAIVPGDSDASEILKRVAETDDALRMPPAETGKRLTPDEIELLRRWIDAGAEYAAHWSFVAPRRPVLPPVQLASWPTNPIDRFILARLEVEGTPPSPPAPAETLLRRATLDLTGLPPTPAELDALAADGAPDAYERAVNRLLASPRYGEQMARDWLDQARYADTHGYFTDHERFMWRWRDWVIAAYNQNLPFDRFTVDQLAGDLLPDPSLDQRIATGFNRNHMLNEETGIFPEEYRVEYVADRVRTTSAVWMGLTVGCAQCHDHKYDPLTQREFYSLFAYFNNLAEEGVSGGKKNAVPLLPLPTPEQDAELATVRGEIAQIESQLAAQAEPAEKQPLDDRLKSLREREQAIQAAATTMVMEDMAQPRETFLLVRGQYDRPADRIAPGVPAFLPPLPADAPPNRLALANWLVDPRHPLTARVAVNRLWRQIFSRGLVATVEDFGVQGSPPSHPDLLDWLAVEFIESGWDVKHIQRLIVTSATYRQSAAVSPELLERDPHNLLLGRAPRYRLDAEAIRDSALFAAGLLVERLGGPSVRPYQPADLWKHVTYDKKNTQEYEESVGEDLYRRGMYTYWKRQVPPPNMLILDAPTRETCTLRRQRTSTPTQALVLLNDPQFVEAARALAQRVLAESGPADEDRIAHGLRLAVARRPTADETADIRDLLESERAYFAANAPAAAELIGVGESVPPSELDSKELAAWTVVGNLLLNLDETLTRN